MPIDPNSIGAIGENAVEPVVQGLERGAKLADMMDRTALNNLQLGQEIKSAKESKAVNEILKKSDYSTPQGLAKTAAEVNRVSPRAAMDLLKSGQAYQTGEIQRQLDLYTLAEKRSDLVVSAIDPIVAQARQMKNSGASDLEVNAYIQKELTGAVTNLRQMQLADGKPALPDEMLRTVSQTKPTLATLEGWESHTKQGNAAIKQRLEQFKADTQARRAEQDERRTDLAERKQSQAEAERKEGIISDDSAQLAVDRILNGEQARDVLANFGRGKQGAQNITKVQNLLADTARERGINAQEVSARMVEFKGLVKEQQTEASIAGKISYAEKEIQQIGPKVLEAANKVGRGQFVPWNKLRNLAASQVSDPNLKQLKAYLTTLTNSYDVLGGRGGTDVEKRAHNRELLDAADSPEALKAAVDAIAQEAALSHTAARESMTVERENLGGPPKPQGAPAGAPKVVHWNDLN